MYSYTYYKMTKCIFAVTKKRPKAKSLKNIKKLFIQHDVLRKISSKQILNPEKMKSYEI